MNRDAFALVPGAGAELNHRMMDGGDRAPFLSGVLEGFYGRPWSHEQRQRLFVWMKAWGLNTYFYAPKDDLKHRADWRSCYASDELTVLESLVRECRGKGLRFVYGLGPGLDIIYSSEGTRETLLKRFRQLAGIGVTDFSLLFDDIPDTMLAQDRAVFDSFADAQATLSNEIWSVLRSECGGERFLFCPTPYCGRMERAQLGGKGYLDRLGERLDPSIDIFWTGPEIISSSIAEDHLAALAQTLRRPPLIWDNLHANDYDLRRLYTGPISGRPLDPKKHMAGILINPNCEFEANFVPIYSLAHYVQQGADYSPPRTFESGLEAWMEQFRGVGEPWTKEEVQLLASLYYLPFADGPDASRLLSDLRSIVQNGTEASHTARSRFDEWRQRIHSIALKLTELENRDLFYTFNRQWWEIREEMDLIARFLDHRQAHPGEAILPRSPEHLPGTYRGGAIRVMQSLLEMNADGSFEGGRPVDV